MKSRFLSVIIWLVALGVPGFSLAQTLPPRQPLGIYFRLQIQPDTDEKVSNNVAAALTNSMVSGILAVFNWSDLNPTFATNVVGGTNVLVGTNDFHLLDDVFGTVEQWNADNPTNVPKTVQLEITPGFKSPPWVMSNLLSCDAMFLTNSQGSIVYTDAQTNLVLVGVNPTNVSANSRCN